MITCVAGRRPAMAGRRPAMAGRRPAMAGRRPAMAGRRPGRYRGNGRRLMPLGPVGLLGCIAPAPVAASTGGGPGIEGARYRTSRWQAATGYGGIAVALPLLLRFRGKRPLWWDPTKVKAPAPAIRPKTQRGCPKEPQTHDQRGEADAPHPGHVRRADLPSLDPVVHDEGTLASPTPLPGSASARETGFSEVRDNPRRRRPAPRPGPQLQALEASSLVVTVTLRTGRALTQLGRQGRERRKLTVRRSRLSREAPGSTGLSG